MIIAEMSGLKVTVKGTKSILYDHRPLQLGQDDYLRVCQIPRRKVLQIISY